MPTKVLTDGNDTFDGSQQNWGWGAARKWTIYGQKGNDDITGGQRSDKLYGGDGEDTLDGGYGDDFLDGGSGNDVMWGYKGNDVYIVDSTGDKVTERYGSNGTDRVHSYVNYTLPDHVENLFLEGNAYSGEGNSLNNVIIGNIHNNTLKGFAGSDDLRGGGGNDYLDGGTGADRMSGDIGRTYAVLIFREGRLSCWHR